MKKVLLLLLCLTLVMSATTVFAESSYNMTWGGNPDPATYNGNQWSGTAGGWMWSLGTEAMFIFARLSDNVYPRLATDIQHNGNTTTVKLREGAKYSDGEEITAKDIWGWFMLHRQPVARYLVAINVVDDYTLDFVFAEPVPFDNMRLWLLANSGRNASMPYHIYKPFVDRAAELWEMAPPVPEGKIDYFQKDSTDADFAAEWSKNWTELAKFVPEQGFVASGPYVRDGNFTEADLRLKKNELYWDAENIKFDVITNKAVTAEQGIAMLKSADSDCYPGSLPIDVALSVLESNKDTVFYPTVDPACHGLYFNQKSVNSPMHDVVFRKAINYVINKTPIREIGNYYGSEFDYSCTGIPPLFLSKYVSPEVMEKLPLYATDHEKAAQILEEAGYKKVGNLWKDPEGKDIKVVIGVNGGWQPAAVVGNVNAMVGEQLREFGIDAEVLVVEGSMFPERLKNNEFCMSFEWIDVSWSFSDPYFTLRDFYMGTYATHMGMPLDEATGLPVYPELLDYEGKPIDPVEALLRMPYINDTEERLDLAQRLIWVADEYCFGINLYQNVTGIWENRATTSGLPYQEKIDEYSQFMPVPEVDDPFFAEIVNLNWGFSGYMKLMYLHPGPENK